MAGVLRTVEKLWGVKHAESRELAEKLYGELTKQILIRKSPEKLDQKVDRVKYQVDPRLVLESRMNPRLIKKRPDNCLSLPHPIVDHSVPIITSSKCRIPHLQHLQTQIEQ